VKLMSKPSVQRCMGVKQLLSTRRNLPPGIFLLSTTQVGFQVFLRGGDCLTGWLVLLLGLSSHCYCSDNVSETAQYALEHSWGANWAPGVHHNVQRCMGVKQLLSARRNLPRVSSCCQLHRWVNTLVGAADLLADLVGHWLTLVGHWSQCGSAGRVAA
jgi:hypothetical protein